MDRETKESGSEFSSSNKSLNTLSFHGRTKSEKELESLDADIKKMSEDLSEFVNFFYQESSSSYSCPDKPNYSHVIKEEASLHEEELTLENEKSIAIANWLAEMDKDNYTSDFLFNGYDDIHFIKDIFVFEDFDELGLFDENHMNEIFESISLLPLPPALVITSADEFTLKHLLTTSDLQSLTDYFSDAHLSTFEDIITLSNVSLMLEYNIQQIGYRRRLLYYINQAKDLFAKPPENIHVEKPKESSSIEELTSLMKTSNYSNTSMPIVENKILSSNQIEVIKPETETKKGCIPFINRKQTDKVLSASYEILNSNKTTEEAGKKEEKKLGQSLKKFFTPAGKFISRRSTISRKSTNLELIPSAEPSRMNFSTSLYQKKPPGDTAELDKIWIHTPSQLTTSQVMIEAFFLGMIPINNINVKGRRLVQESIDILKNLSMNNRKLPSVIVKINSTSLQLLNGETKNSICSNSIDTVFFCAQDVADRRVFCYVYSDDLSKKFMCNVFRCTSVKLSTEAILALGLAFEISYDKMTRYKQQSVKKK